MSDDHSRPAGGAHRRRMDFHARALWAGGAATALVAALVALVGVVVVRGVFRIPVLGPTRYGTFGDASTFWLCVSAAVAALLATALMHLLLLGAPRPATFFGWIVGLITVAVAVQPFTRSVPFEAQVATCAINVAIGLAILTLLSGVAVGTSRRS